MKTIKQLEKDEGKLRKVTEYNEPLHSFSYNELHQRIVGSLEQTKEIVKKIEGRIEDLKHQMRLYKKPEINEFYARINELKELLIKIKGKKSK